MEVEIKLEPGRSEPKVLILTGEITSAVSDLVRRLSAGDPHFLPGWREGQVILLDPDQVRRIYAQGQQVLARAQDETLLLKTRLYELEERLAGGSFLRVSHGELVNFDHVKSLDLSIAGTISLRLDNGDAAFVSRRNMGRIGVFSHDAEKSFAAWPDRRAPRGLYRLHHHGDSLPLLGRRPVRPGSPGGGRGHRQRDRRGGPTVRALLPDGLRLRLRLRHLGY